jgi:hypothetical protein
VTTHDVELQQLLGPSFLTFHFVEDPEILEVFDYRLHPGISTTKNADQHSLAQHALPRLRWPRGYTHAMIANIEIPQEFGGSWATFCHKWCPEGSLGYSAEEISRGLTTLKRLWPQRLAENVRRGRGGTWVPTISTEAGLLLAPRCAYPPGPARACVRATGEHVCLHAPIELPRSCPAPLCRWRFPR